MSEPPPSPEFVRSNVVAGIMAAEGTLMSKLERLTAAAPPYRLEVRPTYYGGVRARFWDPRAGLEGYVASNRALKEEWESQRASTGAEGPVDPDSRAPEWAHAVLRGEFPVLNVRRLPELSEGAIRAS